MPIHRYDKRELTRANPKAYRHPVAVRFQDIDAAGIVFFARIAEYFHDAYFAFLSDRGGIDLPRAMREASWVAPMLHVECDYFAPLCFGDRCVVEVVRAHLSGSDLSVGMRLLREGVPRGAKEAEVVAAGQQAHRFVTRPGFEPCPPPEGFARAVSSLGSP